MGPSKICGCPFREPRVFTIAQMVPLLVDAGFRMVLLLYSVAQLITITHLPSWVCFFQRGVLTLVSMAHTIDFFCHGCHGSCVMRNLLRVSVTAFLCGALMVLPATGTGVLADWPAGAIYPVTVLLDCSELRTGTICQTLSLMTILLAKLHI